MDLKFFESNSDSRSKLLSLVLDPYKVRFQDDSEAFLPYILADKTLTSLLVIDFPQVNGALIYHFLCSVTYLADPSLRAYLDPDQIN